MPDFLRLFCNLLFGTFMFSKCQSSGWYSPSSTLPYEDRRIAVGAYNDTIFLLGGEQHPKQMTEYKIATDAFIDNGASLPADVHALGQICTQIDEIMYIIDPSGSFLIRFNMMSKQFTKEWQALNVNTTTYKSCLASSEDHLFISGGGECLRTLHVLQVSSLNWINSTPSMKEVRRTHSCIVWNNYLWAFGGWKTCPGKRLFTNERINIVDIAANEWNYIDPLPTDPYAHRAVAWQQNIFLIGGSRGGSDDLYLDTVYIVDAVTGTVSTSPDRLVYPIAWTAAIRVHNFIYAFGGYNFDNQRKETFMKYELPTVMPTANPIVEPTSIPSVAPSDTTTEAPSDSPSVLPTVIRVTAQNITTTMETTYDQIPSSSTESSSTISTNFASNSAYDNGTNSTRIPIEFSNTTATERVLPNESYPGATFTVNDTTEPSSPMLSTTAILIAMFLCIGCCVLCLSAMIYYFYSTPKRSPVNNPKQEEVKSATGTTAGYMDDILREMQQHQVVKREMTVNEEKPTETTKGNEDAIDEMVLNDDEFIVRSDSDADKMVTRDASNERRGTNQFGEGTDEVNE